MASKVNINELLGHAQEILSCHRFSSLPNFVTDLCITAAWPLTMKLASCIQSRSPLPMVPSSNSQLCAWARHRPQSRSSSKADGSISSPGSRIFPSCMQNSELTDEHGVGHQQERWASNGKSFNLDELPGELMRHVFFEALQPRSALDLLGISPAFDNPNGGKDPRYMFGTGIFVDDMPANRELLLVSKEVQETAFEIVWIYSRQVFQTSADFVRFYRVHNQLSYVTLNKVCFAFAMEDWAQVMGIPISNNVQRFNFDPANPNRDHTLMQLLRQLQDLQIYFRSSKHTSPPPPVRTVAATEDREAEEEEAKEPRDYPADALLTVMPYQRVICNAILVYAWPWIKDVGKIRLSGCIKDSTKALWLERHLVYRFQGVEPDLREDEKIIQDICEREEPARCECTTQCMFERPADDATDAEVIAHNRTYVWDPED